jgi:hypothetical protein
VYWEFKLSHDNWQQDIGAGSSPLLQTHKIFQLSENDSDVDRETRIRYDLPAGSDPAVAGIDFRTYSKHTTPSDIWQASEGAVKPFGMRRGVWTRIWHYFDFSTRTWSAWVGDENQAPVKILDAKQMSTLGAVGAFWCQAITSQDGGATGPQDLEIYMRNFAVIRDLGSLQEAAALVAAPY